MLRFADPHYLWLLLLVPAAWVMARRLRMVGGGRRWAILAFRTLMLVSLIFALARLELRKDARDISVFFVLDQSDSIPPSEKARAAEALKNLPKKSATKDTTGVIVFGEKPSIETSAAVKYDFEGKILSAIGTDRTDIGAGLRLALAAFPPDSMKRIVLMTDGNENAGSALEAARYAKNNGIPVDVVAMTYDSRNDVQVEKIVVPQRTQKDAPFDAKIYLQAQQETRGKLRLFEDGNLIIEDEVTVQPGRNAPLVVSRRLNDGGFHTYTATFEAAGDARPQNNKASSFTYLQAEPRVLLVEGGDLQSARYLANALRVENIQTFAVAPTSLPGTLEELQNFDAVILSNVPAHAMSQAQMRMLERGVHDFGIGLVMIGGEQSFGAGGYMNTPVEEALPVTMDVKQKKMLPNGALAIVLHTCEMPNGNDWAKEISVASLNVLSAQDYFGVVYFGSGPGTNWGEFWLWEPGLQLVGDKRSMRTSIKGVMPMDMPNFDPALRMAADELVKVKAQTKHIVVISDGDPAPPSQAVVNKIRDNGITVSGVGIFPHDPSSVKTLEDMAYWGGGEYYYPKTGAELPRIFTKEATIVRKSLIREETFNPASDAPSEVLLGFASVPSLRGYVVTTMKELATQALVSPFGDPVLAHWRYGLGKTVAFTSDAKDRWGADWVVWASYAKFWSQTIRWALRETNSPDYQVATELAGGQGKVTIDAVDPGGNYINFLNFETTVIGPDFEAEKVTVQQVAPGRYEGTFPAAKVGTYMVSLQTKTDESEDPQFLTSGVSLSYSPEYQTSASNQDFIKKIAEASGGSIISDLALYNPYDRNLAPTRRPIPLWPILLLLGALLLPLDIFVRRVYLNWAEMAAWVRERILGLVPQPAAGAGNERMASLRAAKSRATQEEKEEKAARDTFRGRFSGESDAPPERSAFASDEPNQAPVTRRTKQTVSADNEGAPPPQQGGMGALMEAKKRAQKKGKQGP